MKEVSKTLAHEAVQKEYVSPVVRDIYFQPEGLLCVSVGSGHEGFEEGGEYDL
jgi:hypothetical protein